VKKPMKLTLFSVEEANKLAIELTPTLERLVGAKREFDALHERVEVLSLALAGASPDNPDARELRDVHGRRTELAEELTRGVQAIQQRGAIVKDLDQGLVDFYTLSGDRLIFLCWQLGESEVAHWHSIEGGFSTRQPLHRTELD
jgi:hypothetical protein